MRLDCDQFQQVIDDLEANKANVTVLANVREGRRWDFENEIDYTILAEWDTGREARRWEIIGIDMEGK